MVTVKLCMFAADIRICVPAVRVNEVDANMSDMYVGGKTWKLSVYDLMCVTIS